MTTASRHWINSIAGLVLGSCALILVTGLLTAAFTGFRADARTADLHSQIDDLTAQLRDSQASAARERANAAAQVEQLLRSNRALLAENKRIRDQLTLVVESLHAHGLTVPEVSTQEPGSTTPPKAPATASGSSPKPSHTPTPRPSTPTPTPSTADGPVINPLDVLCDLTPVLCIS